MSERGSRRDVIYMMFGEGYSDAEIGRQLSLTREAVGQYLRPLKGFSRRYLDEHMMLMTPREVAAMCRVTRGTVVSWIESGKLDALRVGGRWRVKMSDLAGFIDASERPAAARFKQDPDAPEALYSVSEVARILAVTRSSIYHAINTGRIKPRVTTAKKGFKFTGAQVKDMKEWAWRHWKRSER
jgi:excisionase family DNA binding protein